MEIQTFAGVSGVLQKKHALTYLLTPWCRVLIEKLKGLQLIKKFPAFHGTRRFITALTSVHHLSLSSASPIQSINPHPTSQKSILILSTHLCLVLPSGSIFFRFPNHDPIHLISSPIRATCPTHLILLSFITRKILGEEYKLFSSLLCNLLLSPVTSSLLGPNILLNTMFSYILSEAWLLNVNLLRIVFFKCFSLCGEITVDDKFEKSLGRVFNNHNRETKLSLINLWLKYFMSHLCKYNTLMLNPLNTKRRQLYLKTQSVPRCNHFSSRL